MSKEEESYAYPRMAPLMFAILFIVVGNCHTFAGERASIRVTGRVPQNHWLTLDPSPDANDLQFLESASWVEIATVNEFSNAPTGYKVVIGSENGESLVGSATSTAIPYRLKYGATGEEEHVSFDDRFGVATQRSSVRKPGVVNNRLLMEVPSNDHPADEYSDMLVLTIIAN